ncbi:hypothetical protein [Mycoplasma sp. Mirounga ES2805-ORL]|uniref:hypothetical protein n=1 Tax=Mycoplasma sp. Mirounga ES2805-ORL TaxID=754514 RepID=UPI00197CA4C6|nr:hypothetical protein [Mycoplasma sp. Mirounga ES2805-ORL]QSF13746.1 hypothetical protein JXZ90_00385 [Mycoplasma sp. Mirounga ES2805-ORL]
MLTISFVKINSKLIPSNSNLFWYYLVIGAKYNSALKEIIGNLSFGDYISTIKAMPDSSAAVAGAQFGYSIFVLFWILSIAIIVFAVFSFLDFKSKTNGEKYGLIAMTLLVFIASILFIVILTQSNSTDKLPVGLPVSTLIFYALGIVSVFITPLIVKK